jgi:hypothetical protein
MPSTEVHRMQMIAGKKAAKLTCTVRVSRQKFALEDAIGSQA